MLARTGRSILDILHAVTPSAVTSMVARAAPPERSGAEAKAHPMRRVRRGHRGAARGVGLFLWTRGDEVRYEEPPLCERCAYAIAVGGMLQWDVEEEG